MKIQKLLSLGKGAPVAADGCAISTIGKRDPPLQEKKASTGGGATVEKKAGAGSATDEKKKGGDSDGNTVTKRSVAFVTVGDIICVKIYWSDGGYRFECS